MIEPSNLETILPTSDERMMGALAHFFGILGSSIIYMIQKDKSRFVRFQAAQALAFDFITVFFMFVSFFCVFGVMFLGMFGTMFTTLSSTSPSSTDFSWLMMFPALFPFGMVTCIFPFSIALFIARIVAAISVLNGSNFHYPWLGTKIETFLAG
jgi:uncharacterized Tic20 family protein